METLNSSRLTNLYRANQITRIPTSSILIHQISFTCLPKKHPRRCQLPSINSLSSKSTNMGSVLAVQSRVQSSAAPDAPSGNPSKSWRNWLVGVILSLVLPFAQNKWGRLLALKNEVETAVKTVETMAEVVEKVAEEVAEIADEVADQLQDGKLKTLVIVVENMAKETAKDAHITDQLIEKVEGVEKVLESALAGEVHDIATQLKQVDATKDDNKYKQPEQKHEITIEEKHEQRVVKDDDQSSKLDN